MQTITVTMRTEDAEPILREAAREAAEFGSLLDHMTRKIENMPYRGHGQSYDDARKGWRNRFTKAKRMVEAFGMEIDTPSEEETLTVDYPYIGGTTKLTPSIPGIGRVAVRSGSQPDYAHPYPTHRRGIHSEACRHAAERVVRRWKESLAQTAAA